jgi:drug/metabolite transporter (DMT)-like permease
MMVLNMLSTAAATVLFSLFLFGIPYLTARARCRHEPIPLALAIVGFLWFSFVSVSVIFSLVHYEARHALPILPAGCIGIVYAFSTARRVFARRAVE